MIGDSSYTTQMESTCRWTPSYTDIERMLKSVVSKGGKVKTCGTCLDARGIRNLQFVEGVEISNMTELAQWSVEADKVFTF